MGQIYKVSCKCGYEKELYVGGGILSCNINMINRIFSEEKLKEFKFYYENKEVQSFYVENEISICNKCNEIMTIAILKVKLTNNSELEIKNDCSKCGSKVKIIKDYDSYSHTIEMANRLIMCPKCERKMITEETGDWD